MIDKLISEYLTHDIRENFSGSLDDDRAYDHLYKYGYHFTTEFSECNRNALLKEFVQVKKRKELVAILEIGVARVSTKNIEDTSTSTILSNMSELDGYIGIDVDDKSFLKDAFPHLRGVRTLQMRSEDYDAFLNNFIIKDIVFKPVFDFIFIDGWHSINQVIKELVYIDHLNVGGVIGYHDTNYHPGPSRIIRAFNDRFSTPRLYCQGQDWGIGFVTKLR